MAERSVIGTAGTGSTAAGRHVHAVDRTIIEASIADPEQFAIIFRRHAAEIQRYLTRGLGADAADDVVADTFLAAFRQRARYDITYPDARPWLYGIATNLIAPAGAGLEIFLNPVSYAFAASPGLGRQCVPAAAGSGRQPPGPESRTAGLSVPGRTAAGRRLSR